MLKESQNGRALSHLAAENVNLFQMNSCLPCVSCWVVTEHVESGTIKRDKEQWGAGDREDGKQVVLFEYGTFGIL